MDEEGSVIYELEWMARIGCNTYILYFYLLHWLYILEVILRKIKEEYFTGRIERYVSTNTGRKY